ncbi:MAG: arginase family protein [Candidatus Omnitrophica bacterium]|nr:arginase family protein [Candidatus Omnitrophota bacterium]
MLGQSIRILNFDDSVVKQKNLCAQYANDIIDLKDIAPYARCYATSKTRADLARRIPESDKNPVTFLGSGDFHHISELLLSRFDEPLSVIMFDFHPDWDMLPPRYGCGSWVTEVLKKKNNIGKFMLVGVSSDDISSFNINTAYLRALKDDRLEIYPYAHGPSKVFLRKVPENVSLTAKRGLFASTIHWQELKDKNLPEFFKERVKHLPTENVYISIDKDCLCGNAALTNWEEGKLSLDELLQLLLLIKENRTIVGLDICGDYSPVVTKGYFKTIASYLDHPKDIKASTLKESFITAFNEETNLKILKVLNLPQEAAHRRIL